MYSVKITLDEKRETEMIFNIQWKNKSVCVDARSNMVGMLDGSATSDYQTFKSYLLNNSGTFVTNVDNVRVSYVDGDSEYYIENDFDYCYALSFFREKAFAGQYIDLRMDYVDCCRNKDKEIPPPKWFLKYMKKFKEEIVEEVAAAVMCKQHQCNSYPTRKLKSESYKRSRKIPPLPIVDINDRLSSTAVKVQRKMETKLEKLEHKATKIKTKKALVGLSSDSDAGKSSKSETNPPKSTDNGPVMSAALTTPTKKSPVATLSGGETYVHTWDVKNNGTLPWNSSTILKYAWGSQAFEPWEKEIICPYLKPGESGCISAIFNIPVKPGMYECYWHFYNNEKRFGISLSALIVVADNPIKATSYIRGPSYDVINIQNNYELVLPTAWTSPPQKHESKLQTIENKIEIESKQNTANPIESSKDECDSGNISLNQENEAEREMKGELNSGGNSEAIILETSEGIEGLQDTGDNKPPLETHEKSFPLDFDLLDESDDQSIISISDSHSSYNSKDDFVLLQDSDDTSKINGETVQTDANEVQVEIADHNDDTVGDENIDMKSQPEVDKITERLEGMDILSVAAELDKAMAWYVSKNDNKGSVEEVATDAAEAPVELTDHSHAVDGVGDKTDSAKIPEVSDLDAQAEGELVKNSNDTSKSYAYITFNGKKVPVPKCYLREDYLKTAEEVPESEIYNIDYPVIGSGALEAILKKIALKEEPSKSSKKKSEKLTGKTETKKKKVSKSVEKQRSEKAKGNNSNNPCAACGNDTRVFVFPQESAGYEIVSTADCYFSKGVDYYYSTARDISSDDYLLMAGAYSTTCVESSPFKVEEGIHLIKMFILYQAPVVYFGTHPMQDSSANTLVPLEDVEVQDSSELHKGMNDDEIFQYAELVDVNLLLEELRTQDPCDDHNIRYILIPLPNYAANRMHLMGHVDVLYLNELRKSIRSTQVLRTICIGRTHCGLNLDGLHSIVYMLRTITKYEADRLKIRPQIITSIYPGTEHTLFITTADPPALADKEIKKKPKTSTKPKKKTVSTSESNIPQESAPISKTSKSPSPSTTKVKKSDGDANKQKLERKKSSGSSGVKSPELRTQSSCDSDSVKSEFFNVLKGKMDGLKKTVIGTAKDVIESVTLPNRTIDGYWYQGHWISTNPNSKREQNLQILEEMGFGNRDLNATFLARFDDDVDLTVMNLIGWDMDLYPHDKNQRK